MAKKRTKYNEDFELFWKRWKGRWDREEGSYTKVGKFEAWEEWQKLDKEEQQKAIEVAPKAVGKYTPDACRWLKRKRFDDYKT